MKSNNDWSIKKANIIGACLFALLAVPAKAGIEFLEKAQELQNREDLKGAVKILSDDNLKKLAPDEAILATYKRALIFKKLGEKARFVEDLKKVAASNSHLKEYGMFYLAVESFDSDQLSEAKGQFYELLKLNLNQRMQYEVNIYLAKMALKNKQFRESKKLLVPLEKKLRQNEKHPDVIFDLAATEKGLNNRRGMCEWLKKLYTKYPAFSKVEHWNLDLNKNEFQGEPTDCSASMSDFKTRVRYLLFAGHDQEAQAEINKMKSLLPEADRFQGDQIQAQFYALEGEVGKALEVLKPWYADKKGDFNFLIQYANTAARAGESQTAVENYYKAYQSSPKSKLGKQALFQSAFLSYMFQDYDGATKRFLEYQKAFKGSALNQDIQWNLAWIKYLKGQYAESLSDLKNLEFQKKRNPRAWKKVPTDRLQYWIAMSQFRLGQKSKAKALFKKISQDPLYGFYALSAQARLKQIGAIEPIKITVTDQRVHVRVFDRFSSSNYLTPSNNGVFVAEDDDFMSEEDIGVATGVVADDESSDNSDESGSSSVIAGNGSSESTDVASSEDESDNGSEVEKDDSEKITSFSNPQLMKKFERARDLMIVGESEWARWDLYEIEKKTANRDYLNTLMSEYVSIGNYYRASYLGQVTFGRQRAAMGIEGVRYLWEHTYPRAFAQFVEKSSKDFKVPEELIWGIMRAESQYRQDVISPVGALGLMQVMPFTGYKVAQLMNDSKFNPQHLLQPETAITIGSRYLKRLMDKFDNTIPLTAAAYNAGPHRVKVWLKSFGQRDTDEFIEHIPFIETRNYVKKVVSNAYVYSLLYGDKKQDLFPYLAGPMPVKPVKEMVTKEQWDDI